MSYLTPSTKNMDELLKDFDNMEEAYKEECKKVESIKRDFERLMVDNIKKDEVYKEMSDRKDRTYMDMKKYYQGDEKRHKNIILKLRHEIDEMQPIYDIYCGEIKELTGEQLKRNAVKLKGGPLDGGTLYTPGTINPKSTYTDDTESGFDVDEGEE